MIFHLTGPSGVGKNAVLEALLKALKERNRLIRELQRPVSCTTRPPRPGEVHGEDYYFISRAEFIEKDRMKEFAEWVPVQGGYFYGTLKTELARILASGADVIDHIDFKGHHKIKALYPDTIGIFLLPPSIDELKRRMRLGDGRKTLSDEEIARRLMRTPAELEQASTFDCVISNDDLAQTVGDILEIILLAQRGDRMALSDFRRLEFIPQLLADLSRAA